MYRQAIWITFLTTIFAVAVWFIVQAGYEVYHYFQFTARAEVTVQEWSVKEVKSDKFAVLARYRYTFQNKEYTGEGRAGGFYPNPWAAQEAKTRFAKQKWSVWLDPDHPERSALEKHFPLKKGVSAAILLGILVYFLGLGLYLRKKSG